MNINIESSWKNVLNDEFNKPYFKQLSEFVKKEYHETICYPKENQIFAAFNSCSFNDVKVVIIGQDPYHGEGQANGLCFSVNNGVAFPPSLINIFKELETDVYKSFPSNGNLEHWAKQGVLLLNATLTVKKGLAGSHQNKGWEIFTDEVIKIISTQKQNVVFLLWGGFAKKKGKNIDRTKHLVLETGHPSPLSANRGYWFTKNNHVNKHFSKVNKFLKEKGIREIEW